MAYFPMFVDLKNKPCLIVGGGTVAYRKVKVMLDFGARVTVVAKEICRELSDPERDSMKLDLVELKEKQFEEKDCQGMALVIAATDDEDLNHEIAQYCKSKGIPVNAVDQKEDCTFIFPSYIKEQNLVAAFSSGGNSPVLTQYLKGKEQEILTPFLGELNEAMGHLRQSVIDAYDTEEQRKEAFKEILYKAIESETLPEEEGYALFYRNQGIEACPGSD